MKRGLYFVVFVLSTVCIVQAQYSAQTVFTATAVSASASVREIGTGTSYHKLTWNKTGTVSACTVILQSSPDATTWSSLGSSGTCTSNGVSAVVSGVHNYVRINFSAFTGTGSVAATYNGYINDPTGSGGTPGGSAGGDLGGTYPNPTLSSAKQAELDAKVAATRSISTTSPLLGGGDLSSNRTFSLAGLSGLGSANQVLGMNNGATSYEYKTITAGSNITLTHAANSVTIASTASGGTAPIIEAKSKVPVTNNLVFDNVFIGSGSGWKYFDGLGVTDATSLNADATWALLYEIPPALPTGTAKLRLRCISALSSGALKFNPKWNVCGTAQDCSSVTLNAEGTQTVTYTVAGAFVEVDTTLAASTITAGKSLIMNLVFEDTGTTAAGVSTCSAFIVFIP